MDCVRGVRRSRRCCATSRRDYCMHMGGTGRLGAVIDIMTMYYGTWEDGRVSRVYLVVCNVWASAGLFPTVRN